MAPAWEFPGKERDFPRQASMVQAELGGCWETGTGRVVFWLFWPVGISVAWRLCRELHPERIPAVAALFQDLLILLPLSHACPGCQRMG